jgi:hypothetical protein
MTIQALTTSTKHLLLHSPYAGMVERFVYYGSRVHGLAEVDADYDLLCIMRPQTQWQEQRAVRNLLGTLELEHDILLDVRFLTSEDLTTIQGKQPFVMDALSQGWGESLINELDAVPIAVPIAVPMQEADAR